MFTLPNIISLFRLPLALVFLHESVHLRAIAICLAALTDGLDGYLARRYHLRSRSGAFIDPLMDKFFVIFTLSILFLEDKIQLWKIILMLSRDFAVVFFGLFLIVMGHFSRYKPHAIWCGKITTVLQLLTLVALTLSVDIPNVSYLFFPVFGILSLIELGMTMPMRRES